MAKQLNVNLAFTADTSATKRQLQDLQTQLTNISKMPANVDIPLTKNIKEASNAAIELKQHLQNATNVNTNTLDFSKLNQSIAASGTTLSAYGRKLQSIGPEGQKAFMALASSVSQAEIPIRRSNKLLTDMATTLKNTARWQISSSMLHGFMGAVQSAYRYSQDLNESLNNIRIVTGKSSEEMAVFAERANQAARSLSATTTEYTNASLIYYQQGLDGAEVEKRAAITVKMANAAGQTAQVVSNQLTAIWNNFDDGTKSLEYYADVITALGAATASSTDEIAGGLEKFAAIADTIGLSYEYAASALATITANTRQSEDVVGTALKTIFARIQGLNLGETLDDGTTLNKYSEALDKVGVSIYDQSGELKKMDSILNELGNKWQRLNKDQQVALAQTVAGVRQYNQLIALMDNWNNGDNDSMMANLQTSYGSSGTLQEQSDIYAESWEAARDRVTAAAEAIYSSLLDEDFFIGFLNTLEGVLVTVDKVIDSVGGLSGVLSTLGVIATKVFSEQIAAGLRNMAYNLQMSTATGRDYIKKQKTAELEAMGNDLALGMGGEGSEVGTAMRSQYSEQIKLQAEFAVRQEEMNESEKAHIKEIMDMRRALGDQVIAATEKEVAAKDKLYDMEVQAIAEMGRTADRDSDGILNSETLQDFDALKGRLKGVEVATVNLKVAQDKYNQTLATGSGSGRAFKSLENAIRSAGKQLKMTDKEIDALLAGIGTDSKKAAEEVDKLMKLLAGRSGHLQGRMSSEFGVSQGTAKNIANGYRDIARAAREKSAAEAQADKVQDMAMKRMKSAKGAIHDWATGITAAASTALSFVSILNSVKGAFDALTNPELSGWEKFTTILSSLAMVVMMTVSVMESLGKAIKGLQKAQIKKTVTTIASAAAEWLDAEATKKNAKAKLAKAGATDKSTKETNEDTMANLAHAASEKVDEHSTKGNVKVKGELGKAFKDLGASALNWVKANGAVIGGVALIAAGVAVAIGAIAWGVNQYNKYENAALEAAQQADKAAEAYQKVSETYQEFTSNLSAYEEAQKGMDGMTKGTLEYKEAVLKANEAAMKLLDTYDELNYTVDSDGLITINEDSLNKVKQQELKQLQNAQQSSILANQNANNKRLEADKKQFARDSMKSNSDIGIAIGNSAAATGAGAGAGALIGAGIGSIVPVIGTAVGAAAGAIIGGIAGLITGVVGSITAGSGTNSEDAVLEKLEKIYSKEGNAKFADDKAFENMLRDDLKIDDENLIKSLVANREGTLALVKEMAANTAQTKALNEQAIKSEHGEAIEDAVLRAGGDENLSKEVTEAMGVGLEKRAEELYNDKYKDKIFGMKDADIQKKYAEAMGWNVNKIDNHNGNKATYYDDKGNVVAAELDDEVARRFLAQQAALEEMGVNIDQYVATVQSLVQAGNKLGEGIGTAISSFAGGDGGNLGTLTQSQFEDATAEEALSAFDENSQSFIYNGVEFNNEQAKKLGYENAKEFYEAFTSEIARVQNAWDGIDLDVMEKFGLDPKIIGNMSLETAQAFENTIKNLNLGPAGEAGEKAGANYVKGINKMLEGLSTEDQTKALEKLITVDWSNWDALEQADAIMKEFGVDIDTSSSEWQKFAEEMRIAAGATPDFSQLKDTLISITSILQDLDFGSVISEEDYQKLVQYNDEWERFFMLQANGTRVFIGDSNDMQQTLQKDLLQKQQDLQDRKKAQEGFEEANWGHYDETGENWVKANWNNMSGSDTGTAANLIKSSGATEDMLEQLGYTDDIIQSFIDQATSGQEDLVAEGQASLREMYKRIGEFAKEDLDALDEEYKEMIASTATNIDELKDLLNDELIDEKQYSKQLKVLASQATKFKELSNLKEAGLDAETYGDSLVKLGSQYTDCVDEVNAYNKALESGSTEDAEKALEDLEEALKKAEFRKFAKDTLDFLESLKDDTGWANNIENINKLREAYQYLLDTDFSGFSEEFLKSAENINLMTEALKGSDEAWDQLKLNAASEIFNFAGISGSLRTELDAVTAMIAGYDFGDIEIGTELNDTPFWDALSQMEIGSAEAAQAISDGLSSMGVDAELEKHEVTIPPGKSYETRNGYHEYVDNEGVLHQIPINSQVTETDQGQTYTWYTIKGAKYNGKGVTPPEPPKEDRNPSGGGGGGSQPKKATPTKKSDVVQRYKEVEDKLDDIREEADRTRSSLDRLYGAEHQAAIQRLLELEQQEIDLLKEKEQEARNYLQEDLIELKKVSAEVDVEFNFDDKGNIENYEEEMTELYEELAEIQRKAGDEWDENEQKEIDALNEKIKKLEEAMAAYEETRELLEDINAELDAFKGKPALPLITSDTLDIYWEINDALDDIDEQIKDLERKAEGLSGEEKLKVLEEINRLEQERVAILQQQAEANQKDIEEKRAALDELARLNGLQFEYDENGNIANYQEQMGILQAQLDEFYAKRAADGLSPVEEEAMNAIIAKMQELADLAGDYRDAVEESEDILNEIEDTLSGMVADPFVRSDFVDIFKETNDQLDDIDRKISKLQNEADKLTGEARRKKLNEIVTLERKRVEILEHQALIAKTEMEDRKRAMEEIAARQELMFEYDENQNITNYQEQLDVLIDKYEKAYNEALGDDGLIDATEQAILDAISDDIDHLEEFIQAYCDAVEQLEDIEDEREEIANGGYVDMSQLDDIADELHDINQSLDDLQELLDDSSRAADRLYGAARIKQMEKNASLLQQEIDLLQQKKTAQDDIIAKEKQQLDEKTGGYIKYDEYGRITNYDSYINAREDQIREYEAALQEGGLTETEATLLQDEIDLLNEQIAAMEDYEQALEEKEDIQNQIEDAYYEWQDLNAEKLQYKLELQLDVNDRELAKIERAIKRLDGNFYSRAEALALMVGGGMNGDSKLGNYNKQLADLEAHYQEVKRQYEAGEISQAKYVEMTKELQAEIESTADAMAALQDQMDSYYKDTLAQARQELNFHISQLTHLTGILNHFKNTLTALGKSKDYEMMGTVLEGQVQALENEVKASKNAMQMWQKEADSIYQKYQQALSSGNQENADMYYNAYKEALSAANEAENKFYQQSAAWANALRALMENTLAGLAQDLENALTGGTSFDTITTQMKRASSLQEEYLTTTNKIYETTKLMRTAQQEIDKTTNSVAKQKLSQFITETKQMQSQNKLSKYELSIQQAKYDLLVAEIALEEARFAKSTVRLRRDSEGNFGYIYTADAEAIATAEQKFEDAQNKLYNIGLDGANKYTEKYQQTLAEMYNTLTSLQTKYLQGGFESEAEYNAAVLEAKEYYYEKLNQYSELYSVAINAESGTLTDTLVNNSGIVTDALTKNSRIAADAWSTDFADMTTKTDQWMVAVTDYLSQVQSAFADWEVESQRIANETVGTDLTTLKNKVNDIVTESDNLTAAIGDENSGVIKAIYDEITAVSGLVDQYANLNGQLTQAIQNALDLSDALQQDIDQAGQDENPPGQYAPGEEESQKPGTVVPEGTDPLPEIELPEDPDETIPTNPGETTPTEPGETTPTEPGETTPEGTTECTHAETTTQEVAPKCEKGGYKKVLCDSCNKMLENVTYPALGHDYKEGKCTRCGAKDPNWKDPNDVPDNSNKIEGVAAAIWMDGSDVSGWGTGDTRRSRLKEKGVSKAQDYINQHAENGDIYAAWHNKRSQLKQYYYGKFDTGGYTGAWGPEGKWAMLHEKEIVLNKEDTKNFLASLELLDNILSTIDLHAMNSQWTPYLASPGISNIGKEALEQMVTIEANFPNATDKYEIEEAFKDLVNLASQYANRK